MTVMNYLFGLVLVLVVFGVMVLGVTFVPHHGVISLMGISFFCCIFMVMLGRTFAALVMYIVYLGGLVVIFGYCVSVEKDEMGVLKIDWYKCLVIFVFAVVVIFCGGGLGGGLLAYFSWEDMMCMEVNGGGVFYCDGGAGLIVCSWGLLVVLFSILVILSWSRLGVLRPF